MDHVREDHTKVRSMVRQIKSRVPGRAIDLAGLFGDHGPTCRLIVQRRPEGQKWSP